MYQKPGQSKISCGFLRAASKSPKSFSLHKFLFQRPMRKVPTLEDVWYDMVVGERTLGHREQRSLIWPYFQLNSPFNCSVNRSVVKEARKGFLFLQWLWNDGRSQRRIFNGVDKLYVSLQLHCWAILWGYPWRHISYHGNAQGAQKRPLNFSFCKLSEKLIRWPTIFISLLESSLNSLTFQTVWKKFI